MLRSRRWPVLAIAILFLALLAPRGADAQSAGVAGKLSGSLRTIVDRHLGDEIYGSVVQGHRAGTVYSLAKLTSVDATSLAALRGAGATVRHRFDIIGWVAISSPAAAVNKIAALRQVERLEADRVLQLLTATTTAVDAPAFADQSKRGTADVGADAAWADGVNGESVTLGVIDSGIDENHGDLAGRVDSFVNCMGVLPSVLTSMNDVGACVSTPGIDDNGHGTHVTGIAAGGGVGNPELPGMAPAARIAGAKVCNAGGSCLNSSVMAGILQVALPKSMGGAGANVINISLGGGPVYAAGIFSAEQVTDADPEAQLINALADQFNTVFAIAAGNAGPTLQSVGSPSSASQAISVGASVTDYDLNHSREDTLHGMNGNVNENAATNGVSAISTFSSRGPSGDRQIKPDLTAPGSYYVSLEALTGAEVKAADAAVGNNYSTDPSYAVLSGTSMASPAAAGAATLVIDGYHRATGEMPAYYVVKAAMANTAHGTAFEGPVTGLTSSIKSNRLGMDPYDLFPPRNDGAVGVTGTGAGRVYVPDAILASTVGVVAYTPEQRNEDGGLTTRALQPSWGLDDIAPGETATQRFVLHGGPDMASKTSNVTFSVESGPEAIGVHATPASWIKLPTSAAASREKDTSFLAKLKLPAKAAPGQYSATIVATADLGGGVTQHIRIPVQFFVPMSTNTEMSGPIWASDVTDYSLVGFENPLGQIYTDWTLTPVRVPATGVTSLTFDVWDAAGASTMDVFVFDNGGVEINSTVQLEHAVPNGAALVPTSKDAPGTVTIAVVAPDAELAFGEVHAGDIVWLVVSDTVPANPVTFETYHLKVTAS